MAVDDLFKLPLDEFTAARNALAGRLKKAGKTEEAEQIKALGKPPVSAWTVNQLYWRHRQPFDELMDSGERFRKAQAAQLSGKAGDLRGTLDARREALSALSRLAADLLKEAGHNPGPDTMRRVTTTLEALATYGRHPDAPQPGRLTADVDPPGFEALAALVPQVGGSAGRRGDPRVIPFRQKPAKHAAPKKPEAARAAAKAAVKKAEQALRDAKRQAERAEAALKKAAAAAKEAEQERAALEKQLEKAAGAADSARVEARRVAAEAEEAAQLVADAERDLEKAKALLADPHLA